MEDKPKNTSQVKHPQIIFGEGGEEINSPIFDYGRGLRTLTKEEREKLEKIKREYIGGEYESNGLGTKIENVINKVTGGRLKGCSGCKKRRDALNKMFPGKKNK